MIYLAYIIVAIAVVLLSNKASEYVDLLDKKTKLSGAFIGGVMLSAVTSLPELFTSISSTLMLDKPGLCIGNILGSDLFNLTILAVLILVAFRPFSEAKVAKSHIAVSVFVSLIYVVLLLNMWGVLDFNILTVNITSIIVIVLYIIGIKSMSGEDGSETAVGEEEVESNLTVKQIGIRFALVSVGIITLSILITYITDSIATRLNLGAGLAGALFLGIATSLPELASTIALFRMRNFNIAIGNIIGSNIFNFLILAIVDVLYFGNGIYDYTDPKTVNLLVCGAIAMPVTLLMMKFKNKSMQIIAPIIVIACYAAFLIF